MKNIDHALLASGLVLKRKKEKYEKNEERSVLLVMVEEDDEATLELSVRNKIKL